METGQGRVFDYLPTAARLGAMLLSKGELTIAAAIKGILVKAAFVAGRSAVVSR